MTILELLRRSSGREKLAALIGWLLIMTVGVSVLEVM